VTINGEHKKPVYKNELKQSFKYDQPNKAWVGDIPIFGWPKAGYILLLRLIFIR